MDEYIIAAQKLVSAQAGVRVMTEDEIINMVAALASKLRMLDSSQQPEPLANTQSEEIIDPKITKKSITDKSITCLCCGKKGKVLNKKHLAMHGLTPEQYKIHFKLPKNLPLTCKDLAKGRRDKMNEMKLWERRSKKSN